MTILNNIEHPLAVAMWDFSWLERRWSGAGYEDWDQALDELKERGYDAVRIDAYPHLVAANHLKVWELLPCWNQQDWGSPARNRVQLLPALVEFVEKCAQRGLKVALSTWFREDADNVRLLISNGASHGRIWVQTLNALNAAGLLQHLLYVDLCNEWPLRCWAPFFANTGRESEWRTPHCLQWMKEAVQTVREAYPEIPVTFSLISHDGYQTGDLDFFDFLEPHIWMSQQGEFYESIGYAYERFDSKGYENVVRYAEPLYRDNPVYWQKKLFDKIGWFAELSRAANRPLITTECWCIVDYKDWPLLDWGWVKEVCAMGVENAVGTGRWLAMATSNFCGPQFRGMWRDIEWHQSLTQKIHEGKIPS